MKDFARTTFGPGSAAIVRALAEAFFSPDDEVSSERLDGFVADADDFVSRASKTLRFGLVVMLFVIQWTPLMFGRFSTFTALSTADRVHHLERLEASKITQLPLLVVAYKTVLTMLFYEDEAELRALGYPGPERHLYKRLG
jgi:hypothetical protein